MSNYPDTTWEGDPGAPWNEGTPRACWYCAHMRESNSMGSMLCMLRAAEEARTVYRSAAELVDAVERCTVTDRDACDRWEEA